MRNTNIKLLECFIRRVFIFFGGKGVAVLILNWRALVFFVVMSQYARKT